MLLMLIFDSHNDVDDVIQQYWSSSSVCRCVSFVISHQSGGVHQLVHIDRCTGHKLRLSTGLYLRWHRPGSQQPCVMRHTGRGCSVSQSVMFVLLLFCRRSGSIKQRYLRMENSTTHMNWIYRYQKLFIVKLKLAMEDKIWKTAVNLRSPVNTIPRSFSKDGANSWQAKHIGTCYWVTMLV